LNPFLEPPPPFGLKGKTALVTGGASGIGAAVAHELTKAGADLIVADVNVNAAEALASTLPGATSVEMDVTSSESVCRVIGGLKKLDILINNAGIGLVGDIEHTQYEDFSRVMRVNVDSVFLVTQAALPLLLAVHGSVVNISSVAGLVGIKQRFAYCASKGAVVAMTRQLAVEYSQQLRVNCVCPGTVDTPFVAGYLARYHSGEEEQVREQLRARQPVGRLGKPAEVASLVRYLCSSEAEFMQGSVLTIDGGWTAA
jgi:NAD(P)-dependent dehydrogenase (short-subunit alcohol dehydrogenase family)